MENATFMEDVIPQKDIKLHFRGSIQGMEDNQPTGLAYELQKAIQKQKLEMTYVFSDLDEDCQSSVCVKEEMKRSLFCLCPGGIVLSANPDFGITIQ